MFIRTIRLRVKIRFIKISTFLENYDTRWSDNCNGGVMTRGDKIQRCMIPHLIVAVTAGQCRGVPAAVIVFAAFGVI